MTYYQLQFLDVRGDWQALYEAQALCRDAMKLFAGVLSRRSEINPEQMRALRIVSVGKGRREIWVIREVVEYRDL